MESVQIELPLPTTHSSADAAGESWLIIGGRRIRLHLVSNRNARRYVLRCQHDGSARLTVPRRGSVREALRFAKSNLGWLEKQLLRQACEVKPRTAWQSGTGILFRGETVLLQAGPPAEIGTVRFGSEVVPVKDLNADWQPAVEQYLRGLAAGERAARTLELARFHGITIGRVSVRNQRSRWGSCSRRGTISLNWRLVQTPVFVRDYIILHELAHVKEMNHSQRFWREVERLCPNYGEAERWLRGHAALLR